jgi:hypothetical protein
MKDMRTILTAVIKFKVRKTMLKMTSLVALHYVATNISIVPHREQNLPPLEKSMRESCTVKYGLLLLTAVRDTNVLGWTAYRVP